MRTPLFLSVLAAVAWSSASHAQYFTNFITVTTPLDVVGDPNQCSLREAFDNVNAGAKIGTNSCNAAAKTIGDETTYIDLAGLDIHLAKPIQHYVNHAQIIGGSLDGGNTTRLVDVVGFNSHLYVDRVQLRNGKGGSGGALAVSNAASLTLKRAVFQSNMADSGGAVYFDSDGAFAMVDVVLIENYANGSGGAIDVRNAKSVKIRNSRFERNHAMVSGGGLALGTTIASILNSRFRENAVSSIQDPSGGGGAIVSNAQLSIERTDFVGNYVTAPENAMNKGLPSGGALRLGENAETTIADSRFHNNYAMGSDLSKGGAISNRGMFYVDGTTFSENSSTGMGGGIESEGQSPVTIQNTTFIANYNLSHGSALALDSYKSVSLIDLGEPMGGDYSMKIINNTFSDNGDSDQIFIASKDDPDYGEILFLNNIVDSKFGVAACAGTIAKLLTRRVNDPTPLSRNSQFPGQSCGTSVATAVNTLGPVSSGWYFGQLYRKTLVPYIGDTQACEFVDDVDQFNAVRECKLGAVEFDPSPVKDPKIPSWP